MMLTRESGILSPASYYYIYYVGGGGPAKGLSQFRVPITSTLYTSILVQCSRYGITYSKSNMDRPGKVANPARGQLNREIRVRA